MEALNNYFIGLKTIDNIGESSYNPEVIHEYLSDSTQGYGKLYVTNDTESYVYNGNVINGKLSGFGFIKFINDKRYPDYKSYKGELQNGLFHGAGSIVYTNGDIFIGIFNEGKKNGPGKMYNSNGDLIMDNIWKNDVICGKVKYNEHFHNSKQIKISGVLFNSVKVGTWIYHRENGTVEKIEYYKDYDASEEDKLQNDAVLEKTIVTHDSGIIVDQIINSENKLSIEELCLGSYSKYDTKLMSDPNAMPKSSLDKNINSNEIKIAQFYDNKIKNFAIPTFGTADGTLILYLDIKGNLDSIKEVINNKSYEKIKLLSSNLFSNKNNSNNSNNSGTKQYYLITTNTFNSEINFVESKSAIYVFDCINNAIPMLYYEGDLKSDIPSGNGNMYENGNLKYSGTFENGQLTHGMQFSFDSSDNSNSYMHYSGSFKNNIPHGEGTYFSKNGNKIYEGEINEGKYHGNGISYWEITGAMNWNGRWRNHQKHGKGKLYDDSGSLICSCTFEHDQMSSIE